MRLAISLMAWLTASFAEAATITVMPSEPERPTLVLVDGPLDNGDGDVFIKKIASVDNAVVSFNSDGGSVLAGIMIGETIHEKKLFTLVTNHERCASACAIAWLGGAQRFMGPEAKIGFHAAFDAQTGRESGVANAVIGAYLNKIGLPYSAIIYITQSAPSSITWLNPSDAVERGIQVTMIDPPSTRRRPAAEGDRAEPGDGDDVHHVDE